MVSILTKPLKCMASVIQDNMAVRSTETKRVNRNPTKSIRRSFNTRSWNLESISVRDKYGKGSEFSYIDIIWRGIDLGVPLFE